MGGKLSYPQSEIKDDRTFIVTGGNAGIGYQTTKCIAKLGGRVIIACRSEERAKEAIEKMQKEHQVEAAGTTDKEPPMKTNLASKDATSPDVNSKDSDKGDAKQEESAAANSDEQTAPKDDSTPAIPPLKVEFMKLDLSSLASTMEFVNAYKAKGYPLHILICNAGIGLVPFQKTDDGYELHFQVNYLSHFLMTLHLLPLLRESAPNSRIINLTSIMHSGGTLDLKNMQGEVSYDRIRNYSNSKVFQIMNMYALARRLADTRISVFSVHPGYVDSNFKDGSADSRLHRFVNAFTTTLRRVVDIIVYQCGNLLLSTIDIQRNVEDGAMTSLVAALDTTYDGQTAIYFRDCKPVNPSAFSRKFDKQEALWKYSLEQLQDYVTPDLLKDLELPEELAPQPKPKEEVKSELEKQTDKSEKATESKPDEDATSEKVAESKPDEDFRSEKVDEDAKSKPEEPVQDEEAAVSKSQEETTPTPEKLDTDTGAES